MYIYEMEKPALKYHPVYIQGEDSRSQILSRIYTDNLKQEKRKENDGLKSTCFDLFDETDV